MTLWPPLASFNLPHLPDLNTIPKQISPIYFTFLHLFNFKLFFSIPPKSPFSMRLETVYLCVSRERGREKINKELSENEQKKSIKAKSQIIKSIDKRNLFALQGVNSPAPHLAATAASSPTSLSSHYNNMKWRRSRHWHEMSVCLSKRPAMMFAIMTISLIPLLSLIKFSYFFWGVRKGGKWLGCDGEWGLNGDWKLCQIFRINFFFRFVFFPFILPALDWLSLSVSFIHTALYPPDIVLLPLLSLIHRTAKWLNWNQNRQHMSTYGAWIIWCVFGVFHCFCVWVR